MSLAKSSTVPVADAAIALKAAGRPVLSARFWRTALALCALAVGLIGLMLIEPIHLLVLGAAFLPLHIATEVCSIAVAAMIFAVGWHSFDGKTPFNIVVLSCAFLAVGLLDLGHLLSLSSLPAFLTPNSVDKSIGFWLAARSVSAVALLTVALVPRSRWGKTSHRYAGLFGVLVFVVLIYWLVLYAPGSIPLAFTNEQGLTAFKIWSERALVAIYLLAALFLLPHVWRNRDRKTSYLLASVLVMGMSEFCFTLQAEHNGVFNAVGHLYKVIAYIYLYVAIFVDVVQEPYRQLIRSEQSRAQSDSMFKSLLEFAPDSVLLIDSIGKIVMLNAKAEAVFGVSRAVAIGKAVKALIPGWQGDQQSDEITCRHAHGGTFPAEVRWGNLHTESGTLVMAIVRDITDYKRMQKALVDQLTHDALTGLPNRTLIISKLHEAVANANHNNTMLAVLFLDVDFFKKVNDTFGHSSGDEVLRECVNRLTQALHVGDTLARQGGDEFVILQNSITDQRDVVTLADKLLQCMREPFHIQGNKVFLSASLGITLFPDDETSEDDLLHKAQVAMSSVKKDVRNSYRFYTPDMDENLRERVQMESDLHSALHNNELLLHYQPKLSFSTGAVVGAEALVRWQHPVLGLVSPGRFIPLAEENGLIDAIGIWVLEEACTQAQKWLGQGLNSVCVSVNLSARQFQDPKLVEHVRSVLERTGLAPASLELEITESTVMHDTIAAIATLQSLKELGVQLSIDDFGTGYSSLSYLKDFPIDVLKVDQSFVMNVTNNKHDAAITRTIIALAHGLGLTVIAEGVETLGQARFLNANSCDEMQGFYFSEPVLSDEFVALLRTHQAGVIRKVWRA